MPGIYISGKKLPEAADRCLVLTVFHDGCVCHGAEIVGKAVSVLEHGDLIDRNALFDKALEAWGIDADEHETNLFMQMINSAATIIPADRADEPAICTKASPASWGRYGTGKQRAYFAVSIKHSAHKWRFGMPLMLWGYKHTEDDEARCFGGYTLDPDCAEWYALGDFELHGYTADVVKSAPVKLELDFCRKYKAFDTVLVPAKDIYDYWRLCGFLPATDEKTEGGWK